MTRSLISRLESFTEKSLAPVVGERKKLPEAGILMLARNRDEKIPTMMQKKNVIRHHLRNFTAYVYTFEKFGILS